MPGRFGLAEAWKHRRPLAHHHGRLRQLLLPLERAHWHMLHHGLHVHRLQVLNWSRKRRRLLPLQVATGMSDGRVPSCTRPFNQQHMLRRRRWRPDRTSVPTHEPFLHVALASYPRSGNTLLRSLLEQRVHTLTGSDARLDHNNMPLARKLRSFGLRGEGICDDSVWLVKTHFPERSGSAFSPLHVVGAVVLVRNPCDTIDSLWNMRRTRSHTRSVWPLAYRYARASFRTMVREEAASWARFHAFWLQTDACFVRFEDLLDPARRSATLRRIAHYLCGTQPPHCREAARALLGELLEDYDETSGVHAATAVETARSVYRPRRGTAGHALRRYAPEDRATVAETCGELMRRFGYCADAHSERFSNDVAHDEPWRWRGYEAAAAGAGGSGPAMSLSDGLWLNVGEHPVM